MKNKTRVHPFVLVAIASLAITSCVAFEHRKGEGEVVEREIPVQAFEGVVLQGSMELRIHQGKPLGIKVEGQENLVDLVEAVVKNGVCTIRTTENYSTSKRFIIHVTAPELTRVELDGSGDIKGEGEFTAEMFNATVKGSGDLEMVVNAAEMEAHVMGSGNVKLSGTAQKFTATVTGSGDLLAEGLLCQDGIAKVTGSGNVNIAPAISLDATVTGSGDISYSGSPAVTEHITGSGDVNKR